MYSSLDTVWVLLCTALIFFMQAGFAMLETGFTRAKNAGNIIMKNLMDYCIGSVLFWVIGFSFLYGDSIGGFIGTPSLFAAGKFAAAGDLPKRVFLMFATVFCSTATTIVSGAMAGRTKFKAYLTYSAVMSGIVYPITGHWIWNSAGWLKSIGFHDFAGGTAVHVVGGTTALIGALLVGARIGKFDKNGKARAIPGHNLTIGALGIFILWIGWFGFNGGSLLTAQGDNAAAKLGDIFFNTNISAAACAIAAMFITWVRYGKPDVTMTLNGALAGLVASTAGCDTVSAGGAFFIGITAGFVMVFGVELITKLKADDPVGAVSVHGLCGAWGTLMTGVFAKKSGLIYSGSPKDLLIQLAGVLSVAAWTALIMVIVFTVIKKTMGLRVSENTEIVGLDKCEHGLSSSYADLLNTAQFITAAADEPSKVRAIDEASELNASDYKADGKMLIQLAGVLSVAAWTALIMVIVFTVIKKTMGLRVSENTEIVGLDKCEHGLSSSYADLLNTAQFITAAADEPSKVRAIDEASELNASDYKADGKMHKVVVLMNVAKFELLKNALDKLDITGMTVTQVSGCGIQKGSTELYRGSELESRLLPKIKVEIVISTVPLGLLIDTIRKVLYTGKIGDGKIFVYDVANVVKIRTGAEDEQALE